MKKLTIVDGNSLLFRAYYATAYPGAHILKNSKGQYTNAVFGFVNMLEKIIERTDSHMLIAFDTGKPTMRHEKYEAYKAGRVEMPEELLSQIPLVHEVIHYLGIKTYAKEGFEADDIIGSLAKEAEKEGYEVDIYSSDRDLLQLISHQTKVHLLKSGMKVVDSFDPETFFKQYEITTKQFIDLKALMGDPSDNIPGIPTVGEKTGIKLLKTYGSLDQIIERKDEIQGKLGEKIREHFELALLSRELATIHTEMDLPFNVSETKLADPDEEALINFYQRLELKQLIIQFRKKNDETPTTIDEAFVFEVIEHEKQLETLLNQDLALYFEFSDFNYHKANLWGIGLSHGKKHYFVEPKLLFESHLFKAYLNNPKYQKYTYNYKGMKVFLKWLGSDLLGVSYDLLLAAYIIKSSIGKEDFTVIAQLFNVTDLPYDEEIYGRGVKKGLPADKGQYQRHIAKKAAVIESLRDVTLNTLKERDNLHLLNDVELPLSDVLADMEFQGVFIDQAELQNQTRDLGARIDTLRKDILTLAGVEFNVDSPKQLGDVLFETLGLPSGKKTKTGFSTNIEVLHNLVAHHPIIPKIIEYRQLTKLYSTYLIGLKDAIFEDGKIHTIYNQALTLTGRLASLEPNLQNIPIRTEEGRKIRKVFIPSHNNYLLGADYSQIELRVLAEMADVKGFKEAFLHQEDIHTSTAQKVFHVETVDGEQRRRAKAVNFGIIYGIGSWSLAQDIEVTEKEARTFIDTYLKIYPEIKQYMEDIVKFAQEQGYVETMLKRRRYIPELTSKVYSVREFGKRTSLNAPIQGTAADIIKVAMIKLYRYLIDNNKKSQLILQVHDELILDVHPNEVEEMKKIVPEIMQSAYPLSVALKTSCDVGKTWYDLK